MNLKFKAYLAKYLWPFTLTVFLMLGEWFTDGPHGPILKFGLENNIAIFLINAVLLAIPMALIFSRFAFVADNEATAYKDRSLVGRIKWYGWNLAEALVFFSMASTVDFYVTGEIGLKSLGIENVILVFLVDVVLSAVLFSPVFAWTNAWRHRDEQKGNKMPGLFERLGYRAGNYLREHFRK